jgi:hypothetical protein
VGEDVVEEFTTRRVLEDDTDVLVCFDNVVQSDDIRMFKSLKEANARISVGPNKKKRRQRTGTHPQDFDFTFDF